jgi:hypothetical protein
VSNDGTKVGTQTRIMRALGANSLVDKVNLLETQGAGIFQPTATTSALLQQASKLVQKNTAILDLGCGWGIIGLELALQMQGSIVLAMSDLSANAVKVAKRNAEILGVEATIKLGSVFEPWSGSKFDLIISDVSGISEELPFISKWFEGIPIASGVDGLDLVSDVILSASEYLNNSDSKLLMPLISLSDVEKGERLMKTYFWEVKLLAEKKWELDLGDEFQVKMEKLKKDGHVDFLKNGSNYEFFTRIYELSEPKVKPSSTN